MCLLCCGLPHDETVGPFGETAARGNIDFDKLEKLAFPYFD